MYSGTELGSLGSQLTEQPASGELFCVRLVSLLLAVIKLALGILGW